MHNRIAVKVNGAQKAHNTGGCLKIGYQVIGDYGQRKTMKINEKIGKRKYNKNQPPEPHYLPGQILDHSFSPIKFFTIKSTRYIINRLKRGSGFFSFGHFLCPEFLF